jgi:hypothetical protein
MKDFSSFKKESKYILFLSSLVVGAWSDPHRRPTRWTERRAQR